VHHDFKEGNIHVNRGAGGWELSGIFDWMTAALGDAEQDLSRMASSLGIAGSNAVRAFLDAYQGRRPLREGARDRFRLYMLLDRLWIWEYARRNQVWFPKEARFRRFARTSIDLDALL
jgi:aminoglycoside phosphotransferase (APT) family kinase protein